MKECSATVTRIQAMLKILKNNSVKKKIKKYYTAITKSGIRVKAC